MIFPFCVDGQDLKVGHHSFPVLMHSIATVYKSLHLQFSLATAIGRHGLTIAMDWSIRISQHRSEKGYKLVPSVISS